MEIRTHGKWLGLLALSLGLALQAASPATADSIADILQKHKIIGTRAEDCSRPPGRSNSYIVYRVENDGSIKSDFIGEDHKVFSSTAVFSAEEIAPDKIRITQESAARAGEKLTVTMLINEKGTRTLSSVLDNGKAIIADGRIVAADRETVWLYFCGGNAQFSVQSMAPSVQDTARKTDK